MKDIGKLTVLVGLNMILALTSTPQDVTAGEEPEVCAVCYSWYGYVCGFGGGFAHTFDTDPIWCDPSNPQEEGILDGEYLAPHDTVIAQMCGALHTTCEGTQN